jgi:hypothetical protein
MTRKTYEQIDVNADAFMDTVANMIGILTILVVVVAAQSKTAAKAAVEKQATHDAQQQISDRMEDAKVVQRDLARQLQTLQQHQLEILRRSMEREHLLTELLQSKEKLAQIEQSMSTDQQQELAQNRELTELQEKIAALIAQSADVQDQSAQVQTITLQHLPTPMAKTVFGEEVHLMLESNKVSVIPWERLVEGLKRQAELQVSRVVRSDRLVDTLGPVDGFVMNYALKAERGMVARGPNVAMAQRVELEYFVLEPTREVLREDIDQALATGGRLRAELTMRNPHATTVTVWVYDNSFAAFRDLKERLFVEGFLTAARPMPKGIRIGASPSGSSSIAQ